VYRNGDKLDTGTIIVVYHATWPALLEDLTEKCHPDEGHVYHIYDMDGVECRDFQDLYVRMEAYVFADLCTTRASLKHCRTTARMWPAMGACCSCSTARGRTPTGTRTGFGDIKND
jgi:hypothetical protein